MSDPALRLLTEEEYLSTEELSPVRRGYVDGVVYAQAGAVRKQGQLVDPLVSPNGPRREDVNASHADKKCYKDRSRCGGAFLNVRVR